MKFKKFGKTLLIGALSAGVVLSVTSCVQSYTVGFLYVTGTVTSESEGNGYVAGFKIDHNTGKLTPINGLKPPVPSGGANPVRALLLVSSRFLYVLNQGVPQAGQTECTTEYPCVNPNITQFAVGANGVLTAQETFTTQGKNPFRMVADNFCEWLHTGAERRCDLRRHHRFYDQPDDGPPESVAECAGEGDHRSQRHAEPDLLPGPGQPH
ncbi:MAG: hypothetical protein ABR912_17225 [Terracidiphilus sp.]